MAPREAHVVGLTAAGALLWWAAAAYGVVGYESPFTPDQCRLALTKAERILKADPNNLRGQEIRAEAFLCRGLEDDREALDEAIDGFTDVVGREPENFFARLYLAEALRARFPLSRDAIAAFGVAQQLLARVDVGAARDGLARYLSETIRELRQRQQDYVLVFRNGEKTFAAGTASPQQVGEFLMMLALTGPDGLTRAVALLDGYVAAHPDETLNSLYRAELLRGRIPRVTLEALYRTAEMHLCVTGAGVKATMEACDLTRRRLKQLHGSGMDAASRSAGPAL